MTVLEAPGRAGGASSAARAALWRDVLAAEWIKTWSVRSTAWLVAIAAVTAVGGSILLAVSDRASAKPIPLDPVASVFLAWLEYPILAVGILGVLTLTSEFTTGLIRTTFAAVPQRLIVLAGKAVVTAVVTFVVGETLAFISFLSTTAIRGSRDGAPSLGHSGVLRALLAGGVALCAISLLGLGLAAILRSTVAAIATLPVLIYLPLAVLTLPHPWNNDIGRFTLLLASYQLVSEHPHAGLFDQPLSLAVVLSWPAAALLIGALTLTRRDA
jgi:ABC-2 type transport system permease protein